MQEKTFQRITLFALFILFCVMVAINAKVESIQKTLQISKDVDEYINTLDLKNTTSTTDWSKYE